MSKRRAQLASLLVSIMLFFATNLGMAATAADDGKAEGGVRVQRAAGETACMVGVISIAGAIGGLVMGIGTRRSNELSLPGSGSVLQLGFLGDMLIGATASVGIHFVADPLLSTVSRAPGAEELAYSAREYVRAMSLGVISGFAGIKVLFSLSDIPDQILRLSKAQVNTRIEEQGKSFELLRQVDEMLSQIDTSRKGDPATARDDLEKVEQAIRQVLGMVPNDPRALIVKAKMLKRKAELDVDGDARQWWQEALRILDDVIKIDSHYDRAYYNKACYEAILRHHDEALVDLDQAIKLFAPNARFARDDPDFDSMRDLPEFRKLVDGRPPLDAPLGDNDKPPPADNEEPRKEEEDDGPQG